MVKMKHILFSLAFLLAGVMALPAQQALNPKYTKQLKQVYRNTVPLVDAEAAQEIMANENVLILDTRTEREFEVSHIEGAQFVDFDSFRKKDMKEVDRNQKVIVYCSVGYRSERIGERLQKMGFTDVQNLYGGIFEWKNLGNEVVNEEGAETEKVHTFNADWGQWLDKGEKVTK